MVRTDGEMRLEEPGKRMFREEDVFKRARYVLSSALYIYRQKDTCIANFTVIPSKQNSHGKSSALQRFSRKYIGS